MVGGCEAGHQKVSKQKSLEAWKGKDTTATCIDA